MTHSTIYVTVSNCSRFPPCYLFLRNSLIGDLFFTGLFALCFAFATRSTKDPAAATTIDAAPATH